MELIITFVIVLGFVNGQSFDPDAKTTIEILDVDQFKIFNYSIEVQVLDLPPIKFPSFHINDPFTPYDGNRVDFSNCRKKVAVYSHGYATTDLADAVSMKNALFKGAQHMIDCVVLLDWRLWCLVENQSPNNPSNYATVARQNVPKVAEILYDFLLRKNIDSSRLHLIGFSLGAHVSGGASRSGYRGFHRIKADRISAIDPAGPIFEHSMNGVYDPDMKNFAIRAEDAEFVDAIHASTLLGMLNNVGHIDHFTEEKSCYMPSCTHHKALEWYMKSITHCSFISCPVHQYEKVQRIVNDKSSHHFECVNTNDNEFSSMGFMADRFPGRGKHQLNMYFYYDSSWVYNEQLECSDYRAIGSTVAERQCYHPPNWFPECPACRNEDGEFVNYFIMYKLPSSLEYVYMYESHDLTFHSWRKGLYEIDDARSALGQTISQLYNQYNRNGVADMEHVVWNDDDREVVIEETANGHSKGIMAFGTGRQYNRAIFLSHSIPRLLSDYGYSSCTGYAYPKSGRQNAQHAICMSMSLPEDEIVQILNGLTKFKPLVLAISEGSMRGQALVNVMKTLRNPPRTRYGDPLHHQIQLNSGFRISISERTKKVSAIDHIQRIAEDIYQASVKSQTWLLGNGEKWNSTCTGDYTVENIKKVSLSALSYNSEWETTKDHSKWFVSKNDDKPFVCLGDLNRMRSTMARGGLFICTSSSDIYNSFKVLPTDIEECPTNVNKECQNHNCTLPPVRDPEERGTIVKVSTATHPLPNLKKEHQELSCRLIPAQLPREWATMADFCVVGMKRLVQTELSAAMTYLAMGAAFSEYTVHRLGFAKLFFAVASEKKEQATNLIGYLLMRGELTKDVRDLIRNPIPVKSSWRNAVSALKDALRMEVSITERVIDLINNCENSLEASRNFSNDYHLVHYLTEVFLQEQYKTQRELAAYVSDLEKFMNSNPNGGEFLFDKKFLK